MNQIKELVRSVFNRSMGEAIASSLVGWTNTLDCKIKRFDPYMDPVIRGYVGSAIFIFWHEYMLVPCCMRRGCNLVQLTSKHRDADFLVSLGACFGYDSVRGSTSRGGAEAILTIVRQSRGKSLVITPDGPKGPRRQLSNGCIYLASLLGIPVVPLGCGYDRPFRYRRAWDQFALPRLGSRVRIVLSEGIMVPKKISKDEVESYRVRVENRLGEVTAMAEDWAESGESWPDEYPFYAAKQESLLP